MATSDDRPRARAGGRAVLAHLDVDAASDRPGGRTARVRVAVLQATLDELSVVGYAGLGIERIAQRAGVSKTTIYRRWGSKSQLVASALIERLGELVPLPDTGALRSDMLAVARSVRGALRTPWIVNLTREVGPRSNVNDDVYAMVDRFWPTRFAQWRTMLDRAVARGELPVNVDGDFLMEALSGPLYFRGLVLGRPLSDEFLEATVDLVVGFVEHCRATE